MGTSLSSRVLALVAAPAALVSQLFGCSQSGSDALYPVDAGAESGRPAVADAGGDSGGGEETRSTLPSPPGPADVPRPAGAAANLTVLPWAGFTSAVSYTFDDSQPSQIEHWQELKALGVRLTFYLNTNQRSYPSYDETWRDAVANGSELGNHTVNHCKADGTSCTGTVEPAFSIAQQIEAVNDYVTSVAGQTNVWTMAYPYGDTGWESAAKSRFLLARGTSSGTVGALAATDPWNLPTIAASGGESASVFDAEVQAARASRQWTIFLFHSLLPGQNWYAGVDISALTRHVVNTKSLKDVWIDSVVNIGAYWLGQKLIDTAEKSTQGGSTTWTWTLPAHFPAAKMLRVTVDGGTLSQSGRPLAWNARGFYEVALDAGALTLAPDSRKAARAARN